MPRLNLHKITHGHCRNNGDTAEYRSWRSMMRRCFTKTDHKYSRYGARGITVCERWKNFELFLADMGFRPAGHTLDRFPNQNGNYEPANCRWATASQQTRNRACTRLVEIDGHQVPLIDVIEQRQLNYGTVVSRVKRGWSAQEALAGRRLILRGAA